MRRARLSWELDRPLGRLGLLGGTAGVVVAAAAAVLLAGLVDLSLGSSEHDIVILFGINAVLVLGLQTFVGNTGIMSFGHVAFMGLGAYAAGILTVPVAEKAIFMAGLPGSCAARPFRWFCAGGGDRRPCGLICGLVVGPLGWSVSPSPRPRS